MRVSERAVRELFYSGGFEAAGGWAFDKLLTMANTLNELKMPTEPVGKLAALYSSMSRVLAEGGIILVEPNEVVEAEDRHEQKLIKEARQKPVQEPPKKQRRKRRDRFGTRQGTLVARFNRALSEEPKTMKQLMLEAGLKGGLYYPHAAKLIARGFVEKQGKFFRLVGPKHG